MEGMMVNVVGSFPIELNLDGKTKTITSGQYLYYCVLDYSKEAFSSLKSSAEVRGAITRGKGRYKKAKLVEILKAWDIEHKNNNLFDPEIYARLL